MPATTLPRRRTLGRLVTIGAVVMALVLATATVVNAALVAGSLPGAGFTFLSTTENAVLMTGNAIHLKIKGPVTVKTTYSIAGTVDQTAAVRLNTASQLGKLGAARI